MMKVKNITTKVIAIIFSLAITLPVISQTAEAVEVIRQLQKPSFTEIFNAPLVKKGACIVGAGIGAKGLVLLAPVASSGLGLVLLAGLALTGLAGGCASFVATSLGLHYILKFGHEKADSLRSSEKITENHAILDEQRDGEDSQVALDNPDDTSGDPKITLDDTGV